MRTGMKLLAITGAMTSLGVATTPASAADMLVFTLSNPDQTISTGGGTLAFEASVTAASTNTDNEYLNGDSFNVTGNVLFDDTPFFTNFPLFLAPGQSYTGLLFDLVVPAGAAGTIDTGSFSLLGGITANSYASLGTQAFSVTVGPTVADVPEPASWALVISGFGLVGGAMRRRPRVSFAA